MAPISLLITNSAAIRLQARFIAGPRFPSATALRNSSAYCLFSGTVFVHVHNSSKGTTSIFWRHFLCSPHRYTVSTLITMAVD